MLAKENKNLRPKLETAAALLSAERDAHKQTSELPEQAKLELRSMLCQLSCFRHAAHCCKLKSTL